MYFKKVFFVLFSFIGSHCFANVYIDINGVEYHFANSPRLVEVLKPVALDKPWYWSASKLYRLDNSIYQEQKSQMLTLIAELMINEPKLNSRLSELQQEIINWSILSRVDISMDYELARLQRSNCRSLCSNY
jgi:hypothetical protein